MNVASERCQAALRIGDGLLQFLHTPAQQFLSVQQLIQRQTQIGLAHVREAVRNQGRTVELKLLDVEAPGLGQPEKRTIGLRRNVRRNVIS